MSEILKESQSITLECFHASTSWKTKMVVEDLKECREVCHSRALEGRYLMRQRVMMHD